MDSSLSPTEPCFFTPSMSDDAKTKNPKRAKDKAKSVAATVAAAAEQSAEAYLAGVLVDEDDPALVFYWEHDHLQRFAAALNAHVGAPAPPTRPVTLLPVCV